MTRSDVMVRRAWSTPRSCSSCGRPVRLFNIPVFFLHRPTAIDQRFRRYLDADLPALAYTLSTTMLGFAMASASVSSGLVVGWSRSIYAGSIR